MFIYEVNAVALTGTNYQEIYQKAFDYYKNIRKKTRRRPYVRSAYFKKEKVFLELFWQHLHDKLNHRDKARRLKFFVCAIELLQNSRQPPESKLNPNRKSEFLYRFSGRTKKGEIFHVQLKEEKNGEKWLTSVFPEK